ncbi:hypothetical protein [Flavobacterium daemonense]|uniref:hypothetical protein n=1 Tax=Flavobacterium daemonense TaxID=1393049 RepID=UPI0011853F7B|nr:hypothetical protein [Flavobacterium daemonense]KAF2336315.1 hypothetical protein FND99_03270 [Flavobacterium daemonense]
MNLKNEDNIAFTGDTGDFELLQNDYKLSESALRFPNVNSILIPKKAEYNLRKYVSKAMLRKVDFDFDIAVEKCLVFLSNLASTYYTDSKWKPLSSVLLHEQSRNADSTFIYTKIIEVLTAGTSNGAFIEVDGSYQAGVQSKKFRFTEIYLKAGLVEYIIKNTEIIRTRNKMYYKQLYEAFQNPICSNLIATYPKINLPTSEELLVIGKQLVKDGRCTKKGKILTMRNKHVNEYWIDADKRSFVEDNIKLFEFLTSRGFMIPSAGDMYSGGRVVDSFTLMPAWIREQITIDGKKLVECDYSALHPNIAIKLYNGSLSYLTHGIVAEQSGIDLKKVKIEHLSFFNMKWDDMRKSSLFNYYSTNEPDMLARIYKDKNEHGHKITSQKMFGIEVGIMSAVIMDLNAKGVYVLYVYDALLCEEKDSGLIAETMNRIILEHGVKTTAKLNINNEDNPILETNLTNKEEIIVVDASKLNHGISVKNQILERIKNGEELIFVDAVIEFGRNDTILDKVVKICDKQNPEACYVSESFIMSA